MTKARKLTSTEWAILSMQNKSQFLHDKGALTKDERADYRLLQFLIGVYYDSLPKYSDP